MMRTGMTLLEMLLAIALLSAIVMATAAWTQIAAEVTSPTGRIEHERSLSSMNNVLDLIQQDLDTGDFHPPPPPDGKQKNTRPRVTINDGGLIIETRSSSIGAVRHEYRFDATRNEAVVVESAAGVQRTRVLMDQIQSWDCIPDVEHHWFEVAVLLLDGGSLSRRFPWP